MFCYYIFPSSSCKHLGYFKGEPEPFFRNPFRLAKVIHPLKKKIKKNLNAKLYNSPLDGNREHFYTLSDKFLLTNLFLFLCKSVDKKRGASSESVTYRNKIYENFTFSASTINSTPRAQYAQSGVGSNIRSTTTSIPQTIRQTQREECIYEN